MLLDLVIVDRLEEVVLSLGPIDVLGLAVIDILVIHLHLVRIITSHWRVHLHLIVFVDLSTLVLDPRLTQSGDEDAATASTFLVYR